MRSFLIHAVVGCAILASFPAWAEEIGGPFDSPALQQALKDSKFQQKALDTQERREAANKLPKKKLLHHVRNGKDVYMYSDPDGCNCLYMGGSDAYQNLQNHPSYKDRSPGDNAAAELNHEMDFGADWYWGAPGDGLGPGE